MRPPSPEPPRTPKRLRPWIALFAIATTLLTVLGLCFLRIEPPFSDDANLVRTTRPSSITGPSILGRVFWKFHELKQRTLPNPLNWTFAASPAPARSSIHGLLNQCMQAGGVEYLIEKKVAAGSVMFGPPTALNGVQWIHAFENALQTGQPEWWDDETKGFRKENLVLLRHNRKTILVLSQKAADDYRRRFPKLQRLAP